MNRTLKDYAYYVSDRIEAKKLTSQNYVGMDNLLPNKGGIREADYIPNDGTVTHFKKGDVLLGNIRPYLKKIWLATFDGGCSTDVLCIRSKGELSPEFLYVALSQNFFFEYDLKGAKGSKMPRGDKNHIMNFPIRKFNKEKLIGDFFVNVQNKIENNNKISKELEKLSKIIYDYWFTQFDFPDEKGRPYKSSGGKMVWNDVLKREIPEGWEVKTLDKILSKNNELFDYQNEEKTIDLSIMPSNTFCLSELNVSSNFSTNLFKMKKGNILFGTIRPYLKKAGIAPCDGAVAGTVLSYSVKDEKDFNYVLLTMTSENFFNYAIQNSKGTKMPVVGHEELMNYKTPYNKEMIAKFNKLLNLKDIICHNVMENEELKHLRDFLLPLLMNEQVTFKDRNEKNKNGNNK